MKNTLKFFILFLIVFDPQIPDFIPGIGFSALVCIALLPFFCIKCARLSNHTKTILQGAKNLSIIYLLILIFILFRLAFNFGGGVEYILSYFKAAMVFLGMVFYLVLFSVEFNWKFINNLIFIYFFNGLINVMAGTFPDEFGFLEIFRSPVRSNELAVNPYRNSFISSSGYYSIGTAYGFLYMFWMFCVVELKINLNVKMILIFISTVLSGMLAARTSMFSFFAGLLYWIINFELKNIIYLLFLIPAVVLFLFGEYGFLDVYGPWLMGFFDFTDNSSAQNLTDDMFFYPGLSVLLFGYGYVNNGVYTFTDSGFMQDLLFGGVIYSALKFSFIIIFAINFYKFKKLFVILLFAVAILFQLKGNFFYNNAQGMAVFYIIYFYFYINFKYKSNIGKP